MLGTLIALVWANLEHESYVRFAHSTPLHRQRHRHGVLLRARRKGSVEATAPGGALHSPRRAAMPLAAAVGGMLGPCADFRDDDDRARPAESGAWLGDSDATDIAFSYLAARLIFGAKHPAIPFLLLLAIADDASGC